MRSSSVKCSLLWSLFARTSSAQNSLIGIDRCRRNNEHTVCLILSFNSILILLKVSIYAVMLSSPKNTGKGDFDFWKCRVCFSYHMSSTTIWRVNCTAVKVSVMTMSHCHGGLLEIKIHQQQSGSWSNSIFLLGTLIKHLYLNSFFFDQIRSPSSGETIHLACNVINCARNVSKP
jgi:hypothetical protein